MSSISHLLLGGLCHWHLSSDDDGWPSTSIFYRMAQGGNSRVPPGHKILCREMTPDLRRAQVAFNTLDVDEKIIVVVKHMPPPKKESGLPMFKVWGDLEKARYLEESVREFKTRYKRICRKVTKNMRS
jgi:hypothetical protein